jgi:hypothetical protein
LSHFVALFRTCFQWPSRALNIYATKTQQKRRAVAESIPRFELEFRILLLPPISRGALLGGPAIHARRLIQLWRGGEMTVREIGEASDDELIARRLVTDGDEAKAIHGELIARARAQAAKPIAPALAPEPPERPKPSGRASHWDDDDVPLEQAFRLLDVEAVAGAILRTLAKDYATDWAQFPTPIERWKDDDVSAFVESISSRHSELSSDPSYDPSAFTFPSLTDLMPELQELCWRGILDGALRVEAVKSVRGKIGKIPRAVPPVELVRLRPDWTVSRLCRGERDEFIDVRARRAPTRPIKQRWRERPSKAELRDAMRDIAKGFAADAHPSEAAVLKALEDRLPETTRQQARDAIAEYAPRLRGRRGYRCKT